MANNRMFLVCKRCNKGLCVAKYYPAKSADAAGWASIGNLDDAPDAFFAEHAHEDDHTMYGGFQYELRYEVEDEG